MAFFNDPTSCNDLKLTLVIIAILVISIFSWLLDRGNTAIANNTESQNSIVIINKNVQAKMLSIRSLTAELDTKNNNIIAIKAKLKNTLITLKEKQNALQNNAIIFENEKQLLNEKFVNALQDVEKSKASLKLSLQNFNHEKQQLNSYIQTQKSNLKERSQTIEKYALQQNDTSLKIVKTELKLKESRQLSEQQFNEYKQLRRQFSQVQFEASTRLKAINKWQKEVVSLKKKLADTKIKIIESKQRFTVFEMEQDILFDKGQTQLKKEGHKVLARLADIFRQYPNRQIAIQGHSDAQALGARLKQKYASNWGLAASRAASAVHYLQNKEAIAPERIMLVSYAHYRPKLKGGKPKDYAANRRIEITLMPENFYFSQKHPNK